MRFFNMDVEWLTEECIKASLMYSAGATGARIAYCDDILWIVVGGVMSFFLGLFPYAVYHYVSRFMEKPIK